MTTPSPLCALRKARRITQTELARRAGYGGKAVIQRLEQGPPRSWYRLARTADVLGCTTDEILGRVPPEPAPLDALARADRELLDAMQRDALALLGPQVLKMTGGWRTVARTMWLGTLFGLRNHGMPKLLPSGKALPKPPKDWFTGFESDRQKAWREAEERAIRGAKVHRRIGQGAR